MNEIEKMYENAGIALKKCSECDNNMDCGFGKGCYSPFTAEKQLRLIKLLASYGKYDPTRELFLQCLDGEWYIAVYEDMDLMSNGSKVDFKECLARVINKLWQSLTSEQKQQIKEILE